MSDKQNFLELGLVLKRSDSESARLPPNSLSLKLTHTQTPTHPHVDTKSIFSLTLITTRTLKPRKPKAKTLSFFSAFTFCVCQTNRPIKNLYDNLNNNQQQQLAALAARTLSLCLCLNASLACRARHTLTRRQLTTKHIPKHNSTEKKKKKHEIHTPTTLTRPDRTMFDLFPSNVLRQFNSPPLHPVSAFP